MDEPVENGRCKQCQRKVKTYRIIDEDICWVDDKGNEVGEGRIKLTLFGGAGPICRRCMLLALDFLRNQIELGKALVPLSGRTKRFKVIKGGKTD